jgi:hypothetical protein
MIIKEYIDKKIKSNMYKNLEKLKGIEFQEKIKYEFALRDPLNIKAMEDAINFYINNKDDFEKLKQQLEITTFDILNFSHNQLINNYIFLLNIVKKMNFFSLEITNIKEYKHPLIKEELLDIFELLNFISSKIDKNFIVEKLDYECNENLKISKEINKYDDNTFYLKSEKKIDYQNISNHYTITTENPYINVHDNKVLFEEIKTKTDNYYDKTVVSITEDKKFKKNLRISLELNLGLPKEELIIIINSLSKMYKEGNLSKNLIQKEEQTIFKEFEKVGMKYILESKDFISMLFMVDTIKNKHEIGNFNISVIEKELSKKINIKVSTLANLRTVFNNSIKKQLYLQL